MSKKNKDLLSYTEPDCNVFTIGLGSAILSISQTGDSNVNDYTINDLTDIFS